jgi:hypothetical protein
LQRIDFAQRRLNYFPHCSTPFTKASLPRFKRLAAFAAFHFVVQSQTKKYLFVPL